MYVLCFLWRLIIAKYVKQTIEYKLNKKTVIDPVTNCWNWVGHKDKDGYGKLTLNGKSIRAHRLSHLERKGPIENLDVLHTCDNPSCINPNHLYTGTIQDNMRDKRERNRVKGINHPRNKIPESMIIFLRESPLSQCQLARDTGINQSYIGKIKNRVNWTHI